MQFTHRIDVGAKRWKLQHAYASWPYQLRPGHLSWGGRIRGSGLLGWRRVAVGGHLVLGGFRLGRRGGFFVRGQVREWGRGGKKGGLLFLFFKRGGLGPFGQERGGGEAGVMWPAIARRAFGLFGDFAENDKIISSFSNKQSNYLKKET